jgi:hypothetical protein
MKRISSSNRSAVAVDALADRWSLTRADVLLCALPIALFLSIVSLV